MLKTLNQIVAGNLKLLRAKKNWSQEEFSDHCGLHRTYVGAIERGERNITLNTLSELAKALGISASELLTERQDGKAL